MLLTNNNNNNINIIDRKLSKSIMLFKIKINIIMNNDVVIDKIMLNIL